MKRLISLSLIICVVYLVCCQTAPYVSGQQIPQVHGCICSVDKVNKTIEIVPWSKENKSWQIEAKKRISFEDTTTIESGKNKATIAELNNGKAVGDSIKDLGALIRQRATIDCVEEKGKQIARKIETMMLFGGETVPAMVGIDGAQTVGNRNCPCPEGIQHYTVGVDPQKRSAVVNDSAGVTSTVTDVDFVSKSYAYFARFGKSTQPRIAVLTKTFEVVIPLSVVKSVVAKGEYYEVNYQFRGSEKTVLGKLPSGDFKGKSDFGGFILPSKKLIELLFTDSPAYMKEMNAPLYDAVIVLRDGTRVPVAMLQRYLYESSNHFEPYTDIRFFRGDSLTTAAFADLKLIQFELQAVVTVTLTNGKSATGKRQSTQL